MKGKILMVDDNPNNLQVLGNVLKTNGYEIEFATSGKAALKWLESELFDLILLDIMMPEMDGYEVASVIRKTNRLNDMPIIFLTAKVDQESIIKGFEAGGQDYITKPFESRELLVRIKTQIELKQSKSSLKELNKELEQKVKERTIELETLNLELRESRQKYLYALEAANDGIWDWKLDTDEIEFSSELYRMLEYEPNEFPQLRSEINSRFHPDDLNDRDEENYVSNFMKRESDFYNEEVRMQTKSGNYIWIRINGKAVERNDSNEIIRVIGTHTNITNEKKKNHEVLKAILKTEDTERTRISQEIHDGLHQTLTISALNFTAAKKLYGKDPETYLEKFNVGYEYLHKGIKESRTVAHTLMPKAIVEFGLISACESIIDELNMSISNTDFFFAHNFTNNGLENHQIEIIIYRILQEALNNVIKYAKATRVDVQLKLYDDMLMLTVEDNGVGFNVNEVAKRKNKGLGFKSMQNRLEAIYGRLDIESAPNRGTTIIVQIEKNKILNL